MAAIIGIVVFLFLAVCFFMLRSMGRMGQQPSAKNRMEHNGSKSHRTNPRASGLN